jgi:XTP/dITP diphosphohydrolase
MKGSCNNSPPSSGKYLILASTNRNKFFEIRTALGHTAIPLCSLAEFPPIPEAPETGETFAQNAMQKAEYYFRHFHKPVLSEDSGLVIPALDGFPGVNSARIAPDDPSRIALVLDRMREHPAERHAYYVCSVVVLWDGEPIAAEGRCDGILTEEPDGDLGFGYDPIFRPEGHRKTFGRMSIKEKSQYSHRGRAIHAILPQLLELFRNWKM